MTATTHTGWKSTDTDQMAETGWTLAFREDRVGVAG